MLKITNIAAVCDAENGCDIFRKTRGNVYCELKTIRPLICIINIL